MFRLSEGNVLVHLLASAQRKKTLPLLVFKRSASFVGKQTLNDKLSSMSSFVLKQPTNSRVLLSTFAQEAHLCGTTEVNVVHVVWCGTHLIADDEEIVLEGQASEPLQLLTIGTRPTQGKRESTNEAQRKRSRRQNTLKGTIEHQKFRSKNLFENNGNSPLHYRRWWWRW